jgi:cell division initiation protein
MGREEESLRQQLRALRDEMEFTRLELAKSTDELDRIREEKDSYQRLAERLSSEEMQTRELLRAATRTAEDLKAEAKREADEVLKRAEETGRHLEDDARRRVDDLRKEYERIRREYDDFLRQARDVADALVRRIDDARVKWPV